MRTVKEKQRVDRELFSELTESPVNPAEVLFSTNWGESGTLSSCCHLLSGKLFTAGRVDYPVKKVNQASNGNIHRAVRSKFWACLSLNPDEIHPEPDLDGVIEGLSKREQELITENQRLWAEI